MTFQRFLHEGQPTKAPHGPFTFPSKPQQTPIDPHQRTLDHTHLPPSTQPATMTALYQTLDASFLAGAVTAKPLALQGSDGRLTVQIPPGAFDLSHATVAGKPVTGSLTLTLTQQSGLFPAQVPLLGSYTIQITDLQGRTLSGVALSKSLTYRFHYRPSDLAVFNLDPGQLFLTFPTLIRAARSQHRPIGDLVVHLRNDAHTQTVSGQPSQFYTVATYWNYLTSYEDTATGQGASSITSQTAHNNTHGTPASGSDNRLDPLYCDTHSDCTGSFANPDDRAWSVQVVTQMTATGSDSSAVASAQTSYAYGLRVTETASCPSYNGDARCVGDEWMPSGSSDFLNYYQTEYHGFANVYITSAAGDLTSQTYFSNDDWGSLADSFNNYLSGALSQEQVYQGSSSSGPLLRQTLNTYAGTISGENDSCNGNWSASEYFLSAAV